MLSGKMKTLSAFTRLITKFRRNNNSISSKDLDGFIEPIKKLEEHIDSIIIDLDLIKRRLDNTGDFLEDNSYVEFENKFRGSSEKISNRLRCYLPLIQEAKVGTSDYPILDIGCGRGEWLDLLKESGYISLGIDVNPGMVKVCQDKGLNVIQADFFHRSCALRRNAL
jgi:2-polyprenyl-3-methyl-5-hydroxy-6-metoxy-1,4-benzoquinol methylase